MEIHNSNFKSEIHSNGYYGIQIQNGWLLSHYDEPVFGEEPPNDCHKVILLHENKNAVSQLAGLMNEAADKLIIDEDRLAEPHIPLYYILSYLSHIKENFDPFGGNPALFFSNDPIFHLLPGTEGDKQLEIYKPVVKWLQNIGISHHTFPMVEFDSLESFDHYWENPSNILSSTETVKLMSNWNSLSAAAQAAVLYLGFNCNQNYVATIMLLSGYIEEDLFASIVTESGPSAIEIFRSSSPSSEDELQYYKKLATKVKGIVNQIKQS